MGIGFFEDFHASESRRGIRAQAFTLISDKPRLHARFMLDTQWPSPIFSEVKKRVLITMDDKERAKLPVPKRSSGGIQNNQIKCTYAVPSAGSTEQMTYHDMTNPSNQALASIDYGDGSTGTEYSHAYAGAGTYEVTFTFAGDVTATSFAAFSYCTSLVSVVLPSRLTSLGRASFYGCNKLASVKLPPGLTTINESVFYGCTDLVLTSLPSGVTTIGNEAFRDCHKVALTSLPRGVTSIGYETFRNCANLALTSLPSGVRSVDYAAFAGCTGLGSFALPSGVITLESTSFYGCIHLALTTLPKALKTIGHMAFQRCSCLTAIIFRGRPAAIGSTAFEDCANLRSFFVPWSRGEAIDVDNPWGAANSTTTYNHGEL